MTEICELQSWGTIFIGVLLAQVLQVLYKQLDKHFEGHELVAACDPNGVTSHVSPVEFTARRFVVQVAHIPCTRVSILQGLVVGRKPGLQACLGGLPPTARVRCFWIAIL